MNYSVVHSGNGGAGLTNYGEISASAAMARARRLSEKEGDLGAGIAGHSVYLFGFNEDGDQEYYSFFGGSLTEKNLVKDWDQ